jgi:hypothetical protein
MERTIITKKDVEGYVAQEGGPVPTKDDFLSSVMKAIPAEVIGLFLFVQGVLASSLKNSLDEQRIWLWVIFGVGLILTPLFLYKVAKVWKPVQIVVSTAAFAIWVFAIGGPFSLYSWYQAFIGSILLAVFATVMGLFPPQASKP